ncbi:MAG TPA: DUF4249 family protein [Longimicrobium sp.]|jgi:hypothetical protein
MAILKIAVLAILVAGCELARDPVTIDLERYELMVHSVLEAGSDTVAVLLTRVVVEGDSVAPSAQPVSGATVRITGGGESVLLGEASAGFPPCLADAGAAGCYSGIVRGGVRAGETYALDVRVPGGEEARGSARVPLAPVVEAPAAGSRIGVRRKPERVPAATVPVRWRGAGDAGRIGVRLVLRTLYPRTLDLPFTSCTIPQNTLLRSPGTDTATLVLHRPALCHTPGGPVEPDSIGADILVVAYDSAYARYEELVRTYPGKPLQRNRFAAGVTGALGVFAAVARAEREIVLVPVD